jgi:chromosome segregation ATPase
MAITEAMVFEAAEKLRAAGKNPSINEVRLAIGSRGSFGTISEHLKVWRNMMEQGSELASTPDEVQTLARQIWISAARRASQVVEEVRTRLEEEGKVLLVELDRLDSEKTTAQALTEKLEGDLKERDLKIAALMENANQHERESKQATLSLNHAEALRSELESKLKGLREQSVRDEVRISSSEERRQELQSRVGAFESEKVAWMTEKAGLLGDLVRVQTMKECADDKYEALEKQVGELKASWAIKESESLTLQKDLIEKTVRLEETTRQRDAAQKANDALQARLVK